MALVRYKRRLGGWDSVSDLLDLMDFSGGRTTDFGRFMNAQDMQTQVAWHPAVDMYEDNETVSIKMDLPGLTKDEIKISFDGHILSITGTRKEEEMKGEGTHWSRERFSGEFHRYVHIPVEVSSENLVAKFTNGVLEMHLPKAEKAKVRKIPIESGEAQK